MPGYPTEVLVDQTALINTLLCCICGYLLKSAVQSTCGHRYCETCVKDKIASNVGEFLCPRTNCPNVLTKENIIPDHPARKDVEKLSVTCQYQDCGWEGCCQYYEKHMESHGEMDVASTTKRYLEEDDSRKAKKLNDGSGHEVERGAAAVESSSSADGNTGRKRNMGDDKKCNDGTSPEPPMPKKHKSKVDDLQVTVEKLERKVQTLEQQNRDLQVRLMVKFILGNMNQQVSGSLSAAVEALGTRVISLEENNKSLVDRIHLDQMMLDNQDQMFRDIEQRMGLLSLRPRTPCDGPDGTLVWKVTEFARHRMEAVREGSYLPSVPFFTSRSGYKMIAHIYPNGNGEGMGTHLSVYFAIMKGDYDNILCWPFKQKVTFMLLDQQNREHDVEYSFHPDPTSSAFQKPSEVNISSGCPKFVSLGTLERGSRYIQDDCLFLRVTVDVSGLD